MQFRKLPYKSSLASEKRLRVLYCWLRIAKDCKRVFTMVSLCRERVPPETLGQSPSVRSLLIVKLKTWDHLFNMRQIHFQANSSNWICQVETFLFENFLLTGLLLRSARKCTVVCLQRCCHKNTFCANKRCMSPCYELTVQKWPDSFTRTTLLTFMNITKLTPWLTPEPTPELTRQRTPPTSRHLKPIKKSMTHLELPNSSNL